MRNLLLILLVSLLGGCATISITKVDPGVQKIGERMTVTLDGAWNRLGGDVLGSGGVWTMEGLWVDQLRIYSGLKSGESVCQCSGAPKKDVFRSDMTPDEIATMFEVAYTRDGSRYKLEKLEPLAFGGLKGLHFEFSLTRKFDNVTLLGTGYASISKGELFAIAYVAPKLTFYPRYVARVEQIAGSARIRE